MSDDTQDGFSRRVFLERGTVVAGTALVHAGCRRSDEQPAATKPSVKHPLDVSHRSLTDPEYDTLVAAVDRIFPRDEDPGAVELGVPEYIDGALATPELAPVRGEFVRGLAALMRRATTVHLKPFPALGPAEKDALLTSFKEAGPGTGEGHFWTVLIALTMEGLFGDPKYGGNRGGRGWQLIGFAGHGCLNGSAGACGGEGH